ncbi:MAG: ABC transporter permease, partial [Bacillota bacterium]|nr:ABC transporter permease [Bacillota bacterium]
SPYDPYRMELMGINEPPSIEHIFGTDTLGRDLFSVIWFGGRISLIIGLLSGLISTVIALIYGALAGLASDRVDDVMMRFTEIIMSIPQILLVMFIQAMLGKPTVLTIGVVIGITGWMAVAKMVRSEVKQLRSADFVIAARTMGGGFFYVLRVHLLPNLFSAIMFMVVTNIGSAIVMEATLSFLGLGLPTNIISWGSLMSLSQRAILTGCWWMVIIPGLFLVVTLICLTEIGEWIRIEGRKERLL